MFLPVAELDEYAATGVTSVKILNGWNIPAGPHGIVYGHQAGFVESGTLQFDPRQIGVVAGMFVNNAV
jgi:hypothetical protein